METRGAFAVREEDIRDFERDGATCLRGVFDAQWVDRMRALVDEIAASATEKGSQYFSFSRRCIASEYAELREFVFKSPAASVAKRIMRSKTVQFYFDQIFVKEPGELAPTPWHHDLPFWPVQGNQVCSIWLALDPVTKASSGLEYVAGSHRWGKLFKPPVSGVNVKSFDEDEDMPDIAADPSRYQLLNWDMEPGDCLVHQGLTVHGAGGNTTLSTRRRALATRWVGDDATYRAGGGDKELIVPGLATGAPLPRDRFPVVAP